MALITVLRVHRKHSHSTDLTPTLDNLRKAATRAGTFSRLTIITYDAADQLLSKAISSHPHLAGPEVELLPVCPWGFSGPLNASVTRATERGATHLAFVSLEMDVSAAQMKRMMALFRDGKTLMVGRALDQHSFLGEGTHMLTGLTCPWNTCAIWDLSKLAKTGFPIVADTNTPPGRSSIEEVPTIALHQRLFPGSSEVILVKLGAHSGGWDTTWVDPGRMAWQASKMASKDSSAESHLAALELHPHAHGWASAKERDAAGPHVRHVHLEVPDL